MRIFEFLDNLDQALDGKTYSPALLQSYCLAFSRRAGQDRIGRAALQGKVTNMKLAVATFPFFFKAAVPKSLGANLKDETSAQNSESAGV